MSRSYLEVIFRHKLLLILPVMAAFAAGTAYAFTAPREYAATAAVWTDTRVPDASTVGTTGGPNPPSAGQAALLTQLLSTREFLRSVVITSPLAGEYLDADQAVQARMLGDVGASAYVATPGPQLLSLVVTRTDRVEATGLAASILDQFEQAQVNEATTRAKAQLEYDRRRLEAAEQLTAESSNRAAQDLYADAAQAVNESTLNLAAVESSGLRVLDSPDSAEPQSRRKNLILGAAGGLLAGLTLSVLLLVLLMVRDRSVRSEDQVAAAGLDLVGSVPAIPRRRRGTPMQHEEQPVGT